MVGLQVHTAHRKSEELLPSLAEDRLGRGLQVVGESRFVTCHFQGVFPSLPCPGSATGAEELDPALPSRQQVVLIRLCLCLWVGPVLASESCCPFSETGTCPGAA